MLRFEKSSYDEHCKGHPDAKGLYGVAFPYYEKLSTIYSKDIATGEVAEGFVDAVTNLEVMEAAAENVHGDEGSRSTGRRTMEAAEGSRSAGKRPMEADATSAYKKIRKERAQAATEKADPLMALMGEFKGDLKTVSGHIGKMADAAERDVQMLEKSIEDDGKKRLNEKAIQELSKLGFTGSETVRCARLFVKEPDEIQMMFAVPENLRREYVIAMLEAGKK